MQCHLRLGCLVVALRVQEVHLSTGGVEDDEPELDLALLAAQAQGFQQGRGRLGVVGDDQDAPGSAFGHDRSFQ